MPEFITVTQSQVIELDNSRLQNTTRMGWWSIFFLTTAKMQFSRHLMASCLLLLTCRANAFSAGPVCHMVTRLNRNPAKPSATLISKRRIFRSLKMIDRGDFRDGYGDAASQKSSMNTQENELASTLMR